MKDDKSFLAETFTPGNMILAGAIMLFMRAFPKTTVLLYCLFCIPVMIIATSQLAPIGGIILILVILFDLFIIIMMVFIIYAVYENDEPSEPKPWWFWWAVLLAIPVGLGLGYVNENIITLPDRWTVFITVVPICVTYIIGLIIYSHYQEKEEELNADEKQSEPVIDEPAHESPPATPVLAMRSFSRRHH